MTIIAEIHSADELLDVTAADLAADGLTPAEIDAVMGRSGVITRREARDRWDMLRREREGRA